jgi:glycosyltransferase 2 family protein
VTKRLLIILCKYGLAFGLLTWVIWKYWRPEGQPGLGDLWDEHVVEGKPIPHPEFFFLALVLCLASVLLSFVRWFVLVRAVDLPFRVSDALRLGMVGYFFNNFLPGSIGGDVLKATFVAREQERRALAVATVIMDRAIALWALVWFVAILGCAFWSTEAFQADNAGKLRVVVIVAVAICAVSIAVWLRLGFLSANRAARYTDLLKRLPRVGHAAAEFWSAILIYRSRPRTVFLVMAMAFVGFFGFVLTYYFSVRTLADPAHRIPTLQEHFLVVPIVFVVQAVPFLPGGLGLSEMGFSGMYKLLNCDPSDGLMGSLVQRVIFWILGLTGYLIYLRMKRSLEPAPVKAEELTEAKVGCDT